MVQREVDSLKNWVEENVVAFDANKAEVVQFPGRKKENPVGIIVKRIILSPPEHIH